MDPKPLDPTVPFETITIHGTEYRMALNHRAILAAEDALAKRGIDVNLMYAKYLTTHRSVGASFAASLFFYQPETDFRAAEDMVDDSNFDEIYEKLLKLRTKSFPKPAEGDVDPPTPAEGTPSQ